MAIDLLMLGVIGCILEALCTKMVGFVMDAVPTATISLFILFIAVARWNLWGLLIAPLLALSTIIGGRFNSMEYRAAAYGIEMYFSIVIAMMVVALDVIFYKKGGTKKTILTTWKMVLIILMNYVLFSVVQIISYDLITSGHPFMRPVDRIPVDTAISETGYIDRHFYVTVNYIYNLFGLALTYVGAVVLRSQGVINNVRDKLIDDKKQAELDRIDTQEFVMNIEEADAANENEDLSTESESQNSINKDGV